ncbi:MAG: HD domain-containing protein [Planctomycetales bacterium]|nr:HD domain-containing protein [Planctomycetales bacterium]
MPRRFINQLGEREELDDVFLASEKQLRPNRNGNLYLQMRLSDRTGVVNAMMWNANDRLYQSFDNGDYVRVQGSTQVYNGNLQIIITSIDPAELRDVDETDFIHLTQERRNQMVNGLTNLLRRIGNDPLKALAMAFLEDAAFMEKFTAAPAGIKNHHAYPGGLLEHVYSLLRLIEAVTPFYPSVDVDLLLMGGFLHDVGKIDELTYDRALGYSDEGQLVGHLVQGVSILERKLAEMDQQSSEPFPQDLAMHLKHMIVSHHGKLEFGSPKVPMTLEATLLNYLDDMDAKLHSFEQLMREDANVDSPWTVYHPQLGRKLFKPTIA